MKRILSLLIISIITISSFAQTINKEFPHKDKKKGFAYYIGSYPVLDEKILTIYTFPDFITLRLYDKQLNEIIHKDIKRKSGGLYSTDYYLSKKFLIVTEEVGKNNFISKISLDNDFSIEKLNHNIIQYSKLCIDTDEANYYYTTSTSNIYFKKVNINSKNTVDYKIDLSAGEKARIYEFKTFPKSGLIAVNRSKSIKKKSHYQVALHNETGEELSSFERFENNIFKASVFFANNNEEVYVFGNYKEMPKKEEISYYQNKFKKPNFTGIYLKSLNTKNPIEKYYNYSEFKNFNKQLIADKMIKKIGKLRFRLEDMAFVGNERIIFSTIEQDSYERTDQGKKWDGREINYILIFAINDAGEITWDQVITLEWEEHPRYAGTSFCQESNFPKTVNVEKIGDKIKCHYSFKEGINYFELKDGQIVNTKKTLYIDKPSHTKVVEYQYKQSIYWYDNFYFNYDGRAEAYLLDKVEFNK